MTETNASGAQVPCISLLADIHDRILCLPDLHMEPEVDKRWVLLANVLRIIDDAVAEERRKANNSITGRR
jgi:hypothetical protein